jgi:SH3-like domain-containing protein
MSGPVRPRTTDVAWVYTRSGLPVEITAEFENWRRVRDSEGAEGWVYHSLLSGRRTAVVTMKTKDELAPLYDRADPPARWPPACRPASSPRSRMRARLVPRHRQRFDGWIEQQRLWGVYADEKVE